MVSFSLLGLQHPEPNGSRRATPTSTFQHRPGHLLNPSGSNLAVFLSSLTREEQENFAAWSEEIIGYRVRPLQIPGHISLQLTETGSEHQFNLADVGFGFSQLLPIMAQIWAVSNVGNYETDHEILAIEQPELHLHPAYQSKIADCLVEGIAQYPTDASTSTLSTVTETHSPHLINRLGELINQGKVSTKDVAIYFFERDHTSDKTKIRLVTFDGEGDLVDWPFGFFSAGTRFDR